MAKNVIFKDGDQLELPVLTGTLSGSPIVIGDYMPGVALTDADAEDMATCKFSGVVEVEVTSASPMVVGDPVYITQVDYSLADTGDVFYGTLVEVHGGTGAETVRVKIGPGSGAYIS